MLEGHNVKIERYFLIQKGFYSEKNRETLWLSTFAIVLELINSTAIRKVHFRNMAIFKMNHSTIHQKHYYCRCHDAKHVCMAIVCWKLIIIKFYSFPSHYNFLQDHLMQSHTSNFSYIKRAEKSNEQEMGEGVYFNVLTAACVFEKLSVHSF